MPDPRRATRSVIFAAGVLLVVSACTSPDGGAGSPPATTAAGPSPSASSSAPSGSAGSVVSETLGPPPSQLAPPDFPDADRDSIGSDTLAIGWAPGDDLLVVVTFGSSSCPSKVHAITGMGEQHIEMDISTHEPAAPTGAVMACTADLHPFTTLVEPPAGIRSDLPLQITFPTWEGYQPVTVAPR